MKNFGLTILTAFLGGAMAIGAYKVMENRADNNMSFEDRQKVYFASNRIAPITASTGEVDLTQAAAAVTPAVVYIRTTYSASQDNSEQDELMQMFGQHARPQGPQRASGSGVIISTDGYIVTNNHVVEKADKIEVTTNDKRTFQAKVIGTDPNTDLALIKISATDLPIVKLGNSDDTKVGEWVLAVGNPFNLTSTVTAGIISAKGRNIGIIGSEDKSDDNTAGPYGSRTRMQQAAPKLNKAIESFIQTDAAINPGNSGGALVNTKGELIGINAAIASQTGSYEGYGFAIPVNLAKKVLNDLQKYGSVKRGLVGVSFTELNPDYAQEHSLSRTVGLIVNQVVPGGGAEQAGIKTGDIISKVNGHVVTESSDLQETVGRLQPGDKINIGVIRDGSEKNFTVTLKADAVAAPNVAVNKSAEELYNKLGAGFQPLNADQKGKFGVTHGVMVTSVRPGKMFDDLGVEVGSVITGINNTPINAPADIDKALTNLHNGNLKLSGVDPQGAAFNNVYTVR